MGRLRRLGRIPALARPVRDAGAAGQDGQFAWMQSVTRKRWLAVTAGEMLLAAAANGPAVDGIGVG